MTAKQRSGLLRLFAEFFAVLIVAAALSYAGHALVVSRGHEPTPAMFKLREPVHAVFEIILPMIVGAFMVRFFGRRQNLSHVIWRTSLWLQSWWALPRTLPLDTRMILPALS